MMKYMTVQFSNGERWKVPTEIVLNKYALYYKSEFNGDFTEALAQAIWIFELYPEKMIEWAEWKMNCLILTGIKSNSNLNQLIIRRSLN